MFNEIQRLKARRVEEKKEGRDLEGGGGAQHTSEGGKEGEGGLRGD